VASELFRLDPVGVLLPAGHQLAGRASVPVAMLSGEPLLLSPEARAPEFNQFVLELFRSTGFTPTMYPGSVGSVRASAGLVARGRCVTCVPASCAIALPEIVWKRLVEPAAEYPWSVLWRAADRSDHVQAVVSCARRLSGELGWLDAGERADAGPQGRTEGRAEGRAEGPAEGSAAGPAEGSAEGRAEGRAVRQLARRLGNRRVS
jgi:hypothetical protein